MIELKIMPAVNVAYVTCVGSFGKIGHAYKHLMGWAKARDLLGGHTITVYHDNPESTPMYKFRQSACLELSQEVDDPEDDGIRMTTISEGLYAVGRFEVTFAEFRGVWKLMFAWVRANSYEVLSNRGCYEIYYNNFKTHPERKSIIDICIPIQEQDVVAQE